MLSYTIRPVLWTHKENGQSLCPLMIAVTINRKISYINTSYKIKTSQWDSEKKEIIGHINQKLMNASVRKNIADLEKSITQRQLEGLPVTLKILKGGPAQQRTFASFARDVRADEREINRLKNYSGDIQVTDITIEFLRKYHAHESARGMEQNTRNTTFKYIRRIINQAAMEGLVKENPFDNWSIPKYQQTDRTYLIREEIDQVIKTLDTLKGKFYNTTCFFLLGCFSGLRHSDWQRFSMQNVEEGYLKLRAKKNNNHVVLPVGKTLASIIERVKNLPPPAGLKQCNDILKIVGSAAGLDKELTTHVARHSFGCLCASNRLPKAVTAELMGISVQTVTVYYHLTGADIIEQASVLLAV